MQLHEHGLVMNHERRGMFVTELADDEVAQINSLRVVLEATMPDDLMARLQDGLARLPLRIWQRGPASATDHSTSMGRPARVSPATAGTLPLPG